MQRVGTDAGNDFPADRADFGPDFHLHLRGIFAQRGRRLGQVVPDQGRHRVGDSMTALSGGRRFAGMSGAVIVVHLPFATALAAAPATYGSLPSPHPELCAGSNPPESPDNENGSFRSCLPRAPGQPASRYRRNLRTWIFANEESGSVWRVDRPPGGHILRRPARECAR